MSDKKLHLIDGTSLAYRSHFALKLSNSSGFPTGAVYGFYKTLQKIISEENPRFIGVCFDVSRATCRQEKYKEYKIQRPPLPDELKLQIPVIKKLVKAMGIKVIEKEGFEADDIIASLSKKAASQGMQVVITASDKDFYQLLSDEKVAIYDYRKKKLYQKKEFIKEYGFLPDYMADYLSLAGDSSDNIPGAKGIGKVGALELVKEFQDVDNIFANLSKVKPSLAAKLEAGRESVFLSKELVQFFEPNLTIDTDYLEKSRPDSRQLLDLFSELEFKLPKESISEGDKPDLTLIEGVPGDILTKKEGAFAYSFFQGKVYFYFGDGNFIYREKVEKAKKLLEAVSFKKVTINLKNQLANKLPVKVEKSFDIGIAAYLVNSSINDYSLSYLAAIFLKENIDYGPESEPYLIWKLYRVLETKLTENNLNDLFYKIEMPLIFVLHEMESWGININIDWLNKASHKVKEKIVIKEKAIFKSAKRQFNLNSPKQLQEVLFQELKIKPLKKTKTGYSTNEEVLSELAKNHAIAKDMLQYRQLSKMQTTYLLPLSKKVSESGGRLFANFNQTGVQTGRISSSSPNLQSIPVKGEFSSDLRRAFIPSWPGGYIVCADYSQIELRILAHLCRDKNLIEAFNQGLDIHQFTASLLFGVSQEKVSEPERNIAKRVNFGIVYGMSAYGLSKELGLPLNQAQEFIDNYFKRYPKVREYIEKTIEFAQEKGYVETIFSRKRFLPQINSRNSHLKEFAKRQAVNAPIQGSSADIIKLAMVEIQKEIKENFNSTKMIMQIHDELVFDSGEGEKDKLMQILKLGMENCLKLEVPLRVNLAFGKDWSQAAY